jgi:hypothetical protein
MKNSDSKPPDCNPPSAPPSLGHCSTAWWKVTGVLVAGAATERHVDPPLCFARQPRTRVDYVVSLLPVIFRLQRKLPPLWFRP